MLEYLKATRYAKVFEEDIPNDETIAAIKEVEDGKVNTYNSVSEMIGLAQEPTVRSTAEDGDKLEVITVELKNTRALGILKSLEKAQMIKLHQLTENHFNPPGRFKGVLTKERATELANEILKIRNEWNTRIF